MSGEPSCVYRTAATGIVIPIATSQPILAEVFTCREIHCRRFIVVYQPLFGAERPTKMAVHVDRWQFACEAVSQRDGSLGVSEHERHQRWNVARYCLFSNATLMNIASLQLDL